MDEVGGISVGAGVVGLISTPREVGVNDADTGGLEWVCCGVGAFWLVDGLAGTRVGNKVI